MRRKLAKDLRAGDTAIIVAGPSRKPTPVELLTVSMVTITIQRRRIQLTGRLPDGSIIHRKYHEHSGITVPEPKEV